MNRLFSILVTVCVLCSSFGLAQAQTGILVGGHLNLPLSTLGTSAGSGLGLSFGFSYPYNETFDIIGGIGFNPYREKTREIFNIPNVFFGDDVSLSIREKTQWLGIPVNVGIRFKTTMANSGKMVFLEAKGGIIYQKLKDEIEFEIGGLNMTANQIRNTDIWDDMDNDEQRQFNREIDSLKIHSSGTYGSFALGAGIMINKIGFSVEYNMGSWQWIGLKAFYQFGGY